MRAYEIRGGFGLENLVVAERPEPEPGPFQVRVRVKAAALNYRDLLTVQGLYNPKQKLPLIPCSDGAGVIDAVGPGVTRFKVGDRVMGAFAPGWLAGDPTREKLRGTLGGPLDGMLTEAAVLHEEGAVAVPPHLSDAEAATLPCAGLTAWSALVTYGAARAGETLLVQGTGGVSLFALQLGKLLGLRVLATSSKDEKLERAQQLGADAGINYASTPDWDKAARTLTDGLGPHQIIEVGGAGTLERSLKAIRVGGTISLIGQLGGNAASMNLIPILMQNVRVQGILVGHREGLEQLGRAVSASGLRPVVDRVFPFEQAQAAFAHLASGAHFGKVVVAVG
jgi:NADPH:quinone reductase-like Zn-dependent oxidoreductase